MEGKKPILSKGYIAYPLTVIVWIAWGSAFPLIKKCYTLFSISGIASPLMFGGIRFLIAGLFLLIISTIRNKSLPILSKENYKKVLILGSVQTGLTYFFEYIALNYTSGTNSSIVNATEPFLLAIFSYVFYKSDKISFRKIFGMIIGFAGIIICLFDGGSLSFTVLGEGFILIQAVFFCFGSILAKKIASNDVDPIITSGYSLMIGGFEIFAIGLVCGGSLTNGGPQGYLLLGILAGISAFCFMLWTSLCTANPVSKLAPLQFLNPLTGAVVSGLLLGENILQFKYLAALVLVCGGIIISTTEKQIKN